MRRDGACLLNPASSPEPPAPIHGFCYSEAFPSTQTVQPNLSSMNVVDCKASSDIKPSRACEVDETVAELDAICDSDNHQQVLEKEDSIIALISAVLEKEPRMAASAFQRLGDAHASMGNYQKMLELAEQCLGAAKRVRDVSVEGFAYCNLGRAYESLGKYPEALGIHEMHLALAEKAGDLADQEMAYCSLGTVYNAMSKYSKAIDMHEKSLTVAKQAGNVRGIGISSCNLGLAYSSISQYEKAIEMHEIDLRIAKENDDVEGQHRAYGNIGGVFQAMGNYEQAIVMQENKLKLAEQIGDVEAQGSACGNLGCALQSIGQYQRSIELHEMHLKIAEQAHNRSEQGSALCNLGCAYLGLGNFIKAIEMHEQHLKISKEAGDVEEEGRAYGNLGCVYDSLGQYPKSIEMHSKRLQIAESTGNLAGQGNAYGNLGVTHRALGQISQAIDMHKKHLDIAERIGDVAGQGKACCNLGCAYHSLGLFTQALEMHQKDLIIAEQTRDVAGQGTAYRNLGNVYLDQGHIAKAIELIEKSLGIAEQTGSLDEQASAFGLLGAAYKAIGQVRKAVGLHEKHLEIATQIGDLEGQGAAYGSLGDALKWLGQSAKATEMYERSLKITEQTGNVVGRGVAYSRLGSIFRFFGQPHKAIEAFEKYLHIADTVGIIDAKGQAYHSLGGEYESLGQYGKAIEMQEMYLRIAEQTGDIAGLGAAYGSLGSLYKLLGQYSKAKEMHEKHLSFALQTGAVHVEGATYGDLGEVYRLMGLNERAIEMHGKHLKIAEEIGDIHGQGVAYGNLAVTYGCMGMYEADIQLHQKVLKIAEQTENIALQGRAYNNIAAAYHCCGEYEKAIEFGNMSLNLAEKISDLLLQFTCLHEIGCSLMEMGRCSLAPEKFEAALKLCESLQNGLHDRDAERITLFELQRSCYIRLQQAYLVLGRDTDAMAASERGKARALHYLLCKGVTDCPIDAATRWLDIEQMVQAECATVLEYSVLNDSVFAIWIASPDGRLKACKQVEMGKHLNGSLAALVEVTRCAMGIKGYIQECHTTQDTAFGLEAMSLQERNRRLLRCCELVPKRIGSASVYATTLRQGPDGSADHRQLLQDPAQYEEASAVVLQHRDVCVWLDSVRQQVQSALSRDQASVDVDGAIAAVKAQVTGWQGLHELTERTLDQTCGIGNAEIRSVLLGKIRDLFSEDHLSRLFSLLIEPVCDSLPPGSDLLIIPDLQLFGVPWAALKGSDGSFLIESHTVRLAPSLSIAKQAARLAPAGQPPRVAVVGNPWPLGRDMFAPLPCAEDEANLVGSLFGVRPLSGAAATKHRVVERIDGAGWAHLACHGWLERQSLVLCPGPADDGLLTTADVRDSVRLAAGSTVVLSACNTARGEVRGEGVVGLSRTFLAAGAGAVVMSLWNLPDAGTRLLMEAVYHALQQGCDVPAALQFAMVTMLRHGGRFSDPLFWAGFVVAGARTNLPRTDGGVADWSVADVSALFERCGLDAGLVAASGVDGKTLLTLTDEDIVEGFGASRAQLGRLREEQARLALAPLADLRAGQAGGGGPVRRPGGMAEMEGAFRRFNPEWFRAVAEGPRRGGGGGAGDTGNACAGSRAAAAGPAAGGTGAKRLRVEEPCWERTKFMK